MSLTQKLRVFAARFDVPTDIVQPDPCFNIDQGKRGFCWMASALILLLSAEQRGVVTLKPDVNAFLYNFKRQLDAGAFEDGSCPIVNPPRLRDYLGLQLEKKDGGNAIRLTENLLKYSGYVPVKMVTEENTLFQYVSDGPPSSDKFILQQEYKVARDPTMNRVEEMTMQLMNLEKSILPHTENLLGGLLIFICKAGSGHAVSFTYCEGALHYCNTWGRGCQNKAEFAREIILRHKCELVEVIVFARTGLAQLDEDTRNEVVAEEALQLINALDMPMQDVYDAVYDRENAKVPGLQGLTEKADAEFIRDNILWQLYEDLPDARIPET